MYINISSQKMGSTYTSSVGSYVSYLEKEDQDKHLELKEHFFDQENDRVSPERVIMEIDGNTAKLRQHDPKFYSLVVSPNQRELKAIGNDPSLLRGYIREMMDDYARSFNRNQEVRVEDLKYFAKIEHERTYRGYEKQVQENAPYRKEIARLRNEIRKVERGEAKGFISKLQKKIDKQVAMAPHKRNGKMIAAGMKKEGHQTHVHIIVSRRDQTNTYTLSPMAKHKASEVQLNGKLVKRGFDRDNFFEAAEKTFDRVSGFQRNYVESYRARNTYLKEPHRFIAKVLGLQTKEKDIALKLLQSTGIKVPTIPTNKVQMAMKIVNAIKKGIGQARDTGMEIG
mgnify:CR=1 FL=1